MRSDLTNGQDNQITLKEFQVGGTPKPPTGGEQKVYIILDVGYMCSGW